MDWDDIKEYIICKISNPQVWIGVLIIVFGYCHCYLTDDIQGGSGYYFYFGYVSSTSNEAQLSLFLLFSLVGLGCFIYGLRSDFLDERPMLSAFVFVIILLILSIPKSGVVWDVMSILAFLLTAIVALCLWAESQS